MSRTNFVWTDKPCANGRRHKGTCIFARYLTVQVISETRLKTCRAYVCNQPIINNWHNDAEERNLRFSSVKRAKEACDRALLHALQLQVEELQPKFSGNMADLFNPERVLRLKWLRDPEGSYLGQEWQWRLRVTPLPSGMHNVHMVYETTTDFMSERLPIFSRDLKEAQILAEDALREHIAAIVSKMQDPAPLEMLKEGAA